MRNKIISWIPVILSIAAILVAVGGYNQSLGASGTRFPNGLAVGSGATVSTTGSFKVGSNGSSISELKATTCDLIGTNASQAATTTVAYDCAVTGITSSDVVVGAFLATTTARSAGSAAWFISGAKASTTADYVTVLLTNLGPAAVPSVTSVGSSTQITYIDN